MTRGMYSRCCITPGLYLLASRCWIAMTVTILLARSSRAVPDNGGAAAFTSKLAPSRAVRNR